MSLAQMCPECGVTLPENSLEGLCPQCLLKDALKSGPETPARSWGLER